MLPQLHGTGAAPFTGGFDLKSLLANLLLLQGMGVEDHLSWNAPSWRISAEFFAYLLFAGVVFSTGRRAWIWFAAAAVTPPFFLLALSTVIWTCPSISASSAAFTASRSVHCWPDFNTIPLQRRDRRWPAGQGALPGRWPRSP